MDIYFLSWAEKEGSFRVHSYFEIAKLKPNRTVKTSVRSADVFVKGHVFNMPAVHCTTVTRTAPADGNQCTLKLSTPNQNRYNSCAAYKQSTATFLFFCLTQQI